VRNHHDKWRIYDSSLADDKADWKSVFKIFSETTDGLLRKIDNCREIWTVNADWVNQLLGSYIEKNYERISEQN